ncbi:MAG: hemolysin family protein [Actinomycetota bacterium]|nr:hemolysin family protein [Actinomycetota bacterium]
MGGVVPQLLLVFVLLVVNAAFAGAEMALISLREAQLQRLAGRSSTGALLARLAREPSRLLATIQVGITFAGFLASAAAAVSLSAPLEEPLGFLGGAAGPVSIIVVTLILSYFTLVFGELAPKRVAMQRPERWGLLAARPLAAVATMARPLVWLLSISTDVVVRIFGIDPAAGRDEITEEEFRDMVATQPTFTPEQRLIIDGAFEIAARTVQQVLVPRREVLVLDADAPADEALEQLRESGFSRAPVAVGQRLDEVLGVVHLRQLIGGGREPVRTFASDAMFLPETLTVLHALRSMQVDRAQLAVVVNEHGGAEGVVAMEDLVEELVGEIWDETDDDVAGAEHHPDGSLTVPGRYPIHDLVDIGVEVPNGDYSTVAGLVLDRLGHVPSVPGDAVRIPNWRIEVTGVDRRAITQVHLVPTSDERGDEDGADQWTTR